VAAALQLVRDTFVYYYVRGAFTESTAGVAAMAAADAELAEVDRAKLDTALAIVGTGGEPAGARGAGGEAGPRGTDPFALLEAALAEER
jgi:hypothetical protein